jgi:UDP-glucose 4-epimerase
MRPRVRSRRAALATALVIIASLGLAAVGYDIPVTAARRRPGDPAILVASAQRIQSDLVWQARRDLRAIVADAWQFTRAHFSQVWE